MKAHEYWSVGALITMLELFISDVKAVQNQAYKYFGKFCFV